MAEGQLDLFAADGSAAPPAWPVPQGRMACRKAPGAGPGSCGYWWDGCPRAEKRGCYILWARRMREEMRQAGKDPRRG